MFIRLLFLFTIIPVVEIYVILQVGRQLGVAPTVALIILTGIAGAYLARTQGFEIIARIQRDTAQGQLPAESLLDGALVLAGGLLLLTPGFCTDLIGFALLIPLSRDSLKRFLRQWLQKQIEHGHINVRRY
ncbi:FxsA family protein [Geoalkalibacter halelectricus]|uniref:Membrane protein FxsA n=1 Tax=Geoalkalibacter halelectricus TaxID=2847045 RepID=A0ABY5ZRB3_9BACT|nr:FxsA family protein [Geoalkalibacter halelectricus]MDO3380036.1 membrane protein FxsA [Geoalkalibacter halelectricus]UWZ80440.1 membrane protein FxsA [Geoalkalibacter halelectricus]